MSRKTGILTRFYFCDFAARSFSTPTVVYTHNLVGECNRDLTSTTSRVPQSARDPLSDAD
jgi:hypothetical protein